MTHSDMLRAIKGVLWTCAECRRSFSPSHPKTTVMHGKVTVTICADCTLRIEKGRELPTATTPRKLPLQRETLF